LDGGFPRGHTYVVEGQSGTGKTTLGLQFLREGVRLGEKNLYVTLSETKQELEEITASHGWSLEGIDVYELTAAKVSERAGSEQTIFHTADVELTETVDEILSMIGHIRPDRVVFDSITEIRLMAENPLRYRRQVFALRQALADVRCTALFMNVRPADDSEDAFQSLVHGVLKFERFSPEYGGIRRRLNVAKMRGMPYVEGYHDFRIRTGGLEVFPRVQANGDHSGPSWQLMSSGIDELDRLLAGGLETGTACLIMGQSGTGKSSLCTVYVNSAARRGQRSAVFLFDERLETFFQRAGGQGIALEPVRDQGLLSVRQVNIGEMSAGEFAHRVRQAIEEDGAKVVVIDSLTGYLNAMPQENLLLTQMHELLTYLSQRDVLSLITLTQHGIIGGRPVDPIDLSYLADTVLLLRHFEAEGSVRQAISAVKKRHGPHEKTIREMHISASGIRVSEPLTAFSGVLTGNPVYEGQRDRLMSGAGKTRPGSADGGG
jgi:circadian clock protein KaiC